MKHTLQMRLVKRLIKSKSNKNEEIEKLITSYLNEVKERNRVETEEFLADLLVYIMQRVESVSKDDLLGLVESKLSHLNYTIDSSTLEEIYAKSATITAGEVGVTFSFTDKDTKVIKSVNQSLLWLKDDGTISTQNRIKEVLKSVLEGDISTIEIGDRLRDAFDGIIDESAEYFMGVSDHIIRQSQSLNRAYVFSGAGVKSVKVKAVIDDRTSKVCRSLNGRVISVEHIVKQADSIVEAKTIDDKKEASPWQKEPIVGELPANVGLPPYHFRCRTIVVAHFE